MNHTFKNTEPHPDMGTPTLFLPGWGFDGRIISLLQPEPGWIYPENFLDPLSIKEDLLQVLHAKNIRKVRIVGWSMGAMLGLEFAAAHRNLVESLVLVSLRPHWPAQELREIRAEFSRHPGTFLKSFYRKCFLRDKQAYRKFCTKLEQLYLAAITTNTERLQHGLDFLSAFTIPPRGPAIPTRLVHGKQDIIAPAGEMAALPGAETEIIGNAGHFVFLHEDCSLRHELKKQEIQVRFSRAAESYDSYAKVQSEVARRLAAKLPAAPEKAESKTILEIGCGTGNFTALLAARFPTARIVALDFSPEMISRARHKLQGMSVEFVCTEGERFLQEARGKSFDLVTSNGSLQWFSAIDTALHNIRRILAEGGLMSCSIFGPESLKELGQGLEALQPITDSLAAQTFPTGERLQELLRLHFHDAVVGRNSLKKPTVQRMISCCTLKRQALPAGSIKCGIP